MAIKERISGKQGFPRSINLFDIYSAYRFYKFSCYDCKLQSLCAAQEYPLDECKVTTNITKVLGPYVVGRTKSFFSEDFYIRQKPSSVSLIIKQAINIIQQYQK